MTCPSCGATVADSSRFCPGCGNRLDVSDAATRLSDDVTRIAGAPARVSDDATRLAGTSAPRSGSTSGWLSSSGSIDHGRFPPGTVLDGSPAIACGDGALKLLKVQRPGRAPVDADAFLRGFALPPGTVLPSARQK